MLLPILLAELFVLSSTWHVLFSYCFAFVAMQVCYRFPSHSSLLCIFSTNPVQSIEKTFQITRADRDLLAKQEYDLQVVGSLSDGFRLKKVLLYSLCFVLQTCQAWCMLLNDKVQFRMQWPQYADLQVNGMLCPMLLLFNPAPIGSKC